MEDFVKRPKLQIFYYLKFYAFWTEYHNITWIRNKAKKNVMFCSGSLMTTVFIFNLDIQFTNFVIFSIASRFLSYLAKVKIMARKICLFKSFTNWNVLFLYDYLQKKILKLNIIIYLINTAYIITTSRIHSVNHTKSYKIALHVVLV